METPPRLSDVSKLLLTKKNPDVHKEKQHQKSSQILSGKNSTVFISIFYSIMKLV